MGEGCLHHHVYGRRLSPPSCLVEWGSSKKLTTQVLQAILNLIVYYNISYLVVYYMILLYTWYNYIIFIINNTSSPRRRKKLTTQVLRAFKDIILADETFANTEVMASLRQRLNDSAASVRLGYSPYHYFYFVVSNFCWVVFTHPLTPLPLFQFYSPIRWNDGDVVLQKRVAWALFVLLLSTLVCCQQSWFLAFCFNFTDSVRD